METALIETLFHEKRMLYRELAETLKEEKEWIAHADVDALWRVSRKKQVAVAGIEEVRNRILDAIDAAGIRHDMTPRRFQASRVMSLLPVALKQRLLGPQIAMTTLKEEIRVISRENKRYIESYLSMLDDLMAVFTGAERQSTGYHAGRKVSVSGGRQVLHREA